jgi:hypothetical protein
MPDLDVGIDSAMVVGMVGRRHEQLVLAFVEEHKATGRLPGVPRAATLNRAVSRARDDLPTRALGITRVSRVRKLPSRDSRGRFVAFAMTDAPSWYVFCTDGYRITGEPDAEVLPAGAPVLRHSLPRAVARFNRLRPARSDLLTYAAFVIGYIALLWYGIQLPRPPR